MPVIIGEISIVPLGEGTSVSRFVKLAVAVLRDTKLKVFSGPMCTCLEGENIEEILSAVKSAHQAVIDAGAKRVVTTLKIDDRRDKQATMQKKMQAVQ